MVRYLFFDFDGVILDSEGQYQKYWILGCKENGYDLSIEQELTLRSQDHQITNDYFKKIFGEDCSYDDIHKSRIRMMDEYLLTNHLYLKDGVIETLDYIKKNTSLKLAIVSSSPIPYIQKHAGFNGVLDYFDKIISAKDVKRGKPFPDVYLKALEEAKINKEEVIVFEDSPNGIRSAYNAGLKVVFVEDLSPADEEIKNKSIYQFKSIREIAPLIDKNF